MTNEKYKIDIQMKGMDGKLVSGICYVDNGIAISHFNKSGFTKKLFDLNKTKNSSYDEKNDCFVEKYPNMTKEQIRDKILKELNKNKIKF